MKPIDKVKEVLAEGQIDYCPQLRRIDDLFFCQQMEIDTKGDKRINDWCTVEDLAKCPLSHR